MNKNIIEKTNHLPAADFLRGVAILFVVSFHVFGVLCGWQLPWNGVFRNFDSPPSRYFYSFYPISLGWSGVSLFFVLSGFCIYLSYFRKGEFKPRYFFWQRFWRIYPAYFLALVVFFILERRNMTGSDAYFQFISHALLIHNFSTKDFFGINPSFWSIAVEIQLYLLFPLLLVIKNKLGMRSCLLITGFLGVFWKISAMVIAGFPDEAISIIFSSPIACWFDWTLGVWVADCLVNEKWAFQHHRYWLIGLIPLFIFSTLYQPFIAFSFTLAALIFAVVLDCMIRMQKMQNLALRTVSFIGVISYSIYLWHQPLIFRLKWYSLSFFPNLKDYTICFIVTFVIFSFCCFSYYFVELKGIKLGKIISGVLTRIPLDRTR